MASAGVGGKVIVYLCVPICLGPPGQGVSSAGSRPSVAVCLASPVPGWVLSIMQCVLSMGVWSLEFLEWQCGKDTQHQAGNTPVANSIPSCSLTGSDLMGQALRRSHMF